MADRETPVEQVGGVVLPKPWPGSIVHLPASLGGRDSFFDESDASAAPAEESKAPVEPKSTEAASAPEAAPAPAAAPAAASEPASVMYPPALPVPPVPGTVLRPPRAPRRPAPVRGAEAKPAATSAPEAEQTPNAPTHPPPSIPAPSRAAPTRPADPSAAAAAAAAPVVASAAASVSAGASSADEVKARDELLAQFDTVMLDCDGVIWLGNQPIEGGQEVLARLRSLGKRVVFVSNNSSKDRAEYRQKFEKMGIAAAPEDIVCSSYAVAAYLDALSKAGQLDKTKRVFVVGSGGIRRELEQVGFSCISADEEVGDKHFTPEELGTFPVVSDIGAVVVGQDTRFTYSKCAYAAQLLHRDPTCLFVSTNRDETFPMTGRYLPGTGCVVRMIATAAMRPPVDVGKPSPWMFELIKWRFKLDSAKVLFIGDRMSTDIRMGNAGGASTLLVLTGVNTHTDVLENTDADAMPTYVAASLADLC